MSLPKARTSRKSAPAIRLAPELPAALKTGLVLISQIWTAPENDKLYGKTTQADQNFRELLTSTKSFGIREQLVVTEDGAIISGNRRRLAAELAGIIEVPVIVEPFRYADDRGRFLRLLREHNRHRDKTNAQKLREELVSLNPNDTYAKLTNYRRAQSTIRVKAMPLRAGVARSKISPARLPFLKAVQELIAGAGCAPSLRQLHYWLLNAPPLVHSSKPGSRYKNDRASYQALSDLVTRARIAGDIAMDAITDETRPVVTWDVHSSTRSFIRRECRQFLNGYWRDFEQAQENHHEIIGEKATLTSIVRPVAWTYRIPYTIGRGYSSLPPRYEMAQRFEHSGKDKLVLFMLSDLDPDGDEISHSFARSMRDDFGIENIHPIRVALTQKQVKKYKLPPIMSAKQSSRQYDRFVDTHDSDNVYELEALRPDDLKEILRSTIESVLDLDALNAEMKEERNDAHFLAGVRNTMRDSMLDMNIEGIESDDDFEDDG